MNDHLGYTNEDIKELVKAVRDLQQSITQEKTESYVMLSEIKRTLQENLSNLALVTRAIFNKLPTLTNEDIRTLIDTQIDLRQRFRLVPLKITRNSDNYITQIKYEFLDQIITVDYTLDSNNYITGKSVKVEGE